MENDYVDISYFILLYVIPQTRQMKDNLGVNNSNHIINVVILRVAMVTMYIVAFRSLPTIKYGFSALRANPLILLHLCETAEKGKLLQDNSLKSFFIILLGIIALLPIFKTLTAEIATDTIWLNFFICQIIYCIGSVRSTILQRKRNIPSYDRNYVIPLDESLLISKKITASNEASSIAAVIGFILIFSRIQNNFDIVYLQTIGFLLYFFMPKFLEYKKVYLYDMQTILFVSSVVLISFWVDRSVCMIFSGITATVYIGMKSMTSILE